MRPTVFLIGFKPWKTFMPRWLPESRVIRCVTGVLSLPDFLRRIPQILRGSSSSICVWSYSAPWYVEFLCRSYSVPLVRVEDGFLRSVGFGSEQTPPLSLCFAEKALYFDATVESDLEHILQTYDFKNNPELIGRARRGISTFVWSRLSKYNAGRATDVQVLYGPKTKRRILVVGQIEGDMSMIKGMTRRMTNNDFVREVVGENPDAQVIYKPHPEALKGLRRRPRQSNPNEVRDICLVLDEDIALADAFETVDRVYTMTSLSGFEALIRGIPVTCFGSPFYSGWGVTEDREHCPRRTARRSVEEIFAAAYVLYPRYRHPISGEPLEFEGALDLLQRMVADERSGTA
ncbi:capsular polysaccharide biosynthesis protein [Ciceribacter sp. RN22]|uniref:capsular polysaccharide export protein, LipB/KpsS family n=1 Tax=Ciceribacter sp. RN22 TaxID=2954932 RepID=UPI002091F7D7|nr:capsular polysaccharide biosynthesis protein [Ciceribacter sp. RN22]MCO6179004.1 capsular polysaccharide biosynthesis protein [Ciceribacter sp. RN22]